MTAVSVAIPTLNAGGRFGETLAAVRAQQLDADVELVVLDSGSSDDTVAIARRHDASVAELGAPFNHGAARNRLMAITEGDHVAFLTQDAVPADVSWLRRLLDGFALAPDVALVCGPYLPRPEASVCVRRELADLWRTFSPDGRPHVYRAVDLRRDASGHVVPSAASFFSDVNGCVARAAWLETPYRAVPYAEDHRLALDMLAAGRAKVFHPGAAVVHSHEYSPLQRFRRSFDEFRGLREVYGHVEGFGARMTLGRARLEARRDRALLHHEGLPVRAVDDATVASFTSHLARGIGAGLGSRADRLPSPVRRWCSLERRGTFEPTA